MPLTWRLRQLTNETALVRSCEFEMNSNGRCIALITIYYDCGIQPAWYFYGTPGGRGLDKSRSTDDVLSSTCFSPLIREERTQSDGTKIELAHFVRATKRGTLFAGSALAGGDAIFVEFVQPCQHALELLLSARHSDN